VSERSRHKRRIVIVVGNDLMNGDCRIVKFDHEKILCNRRLVEVDEPTTSFRRLIELVIEDTARSAAR